MPKSFLEYLIMKYLYSISLSLFNVFSFAQVPWPQNVSKYSCIDSTTIEMRYEFKYKNHHTQKEYNEDVRVVQIGKTVVKEYSEALFFYDSLATEYSKLGKDVPSIQTAPYPCESFIQKREKIIDVKYRLLMNIGTLCYQTKQPRFAWNYSSDDGINILGYNCNKATTIFAGREYVAWYTLEVPIHYGPFKFWGLSGLIVRIEEKNGMYVWNLLRLSSKSKGIYVYKYDNEQECSEEMANRTITRMMSNPLAFEMSNTDIPIYSYKNGKLIPIPMEGKEEAYEPIELQ